MSVSHKVWKLVRQQSDKHPNDVELAVAGLMNEVQALPEYEGYVTELVRVALIRLIHQHRSQVNSSIRAQETHEVPVVRDSTSKVRVSESKQVQRVYACYNYRIGGRTLGSMCLGDIDAIIPSEQRRLKGHETNIQILIRCREILQEAQSKKKATEATVLKEVITEKDLDQIIQSSMCEHEPEAAEV